MFIGTSLIKAELRTGRWNGVSAILAHEFAHAMQAKRNCTLKGKWLELHADLMAGWYAAQKNQALHQNDMIAFFSLSDKGDRSFGSPDHHGTPEERGTAFMLGYQKGREFDATKVYREGLEDITYWMKSR